MEFAGRGFLFVFLSIPVCGKTFEIGVKLEIQPRMTSGDQVVIDGLRGAGREARSDVAVHAHTRSLLQILGINLTIATLGICGETLRVKLMLEQPTACRAMTRFAVDT